MNLITKITSSPKILVESSICNPLFKYSDNNFYHWNRAVHIIWRNVYGFESGIRIPIVNKLDEYEFNTLIN